MFSDSKFQLAHFNSYWAVSYSGVEIRQALGPIAPKIWWGPSKCKNQGSQWPSEMLNHFNTWCIKDIRKSNLALNKIWGPSIFHYQGPKFFAYFNPWSFFHFFFWSTYFLLCKLIEAQLINQSIINLKWLRTLRNLSFLWLICHAVQNHQCIYFIRCRIN